MASDYMNDRVARTRELSGWLRSNPKLDDDSIANLASELDQTANALQTMLDVSDRFRAIAVWRVGLLKKIAEAASAAMDRPPKDLPIPPSGTGYEPSKH